MKRTHPAFWGAGWAGVAVGGLMVLLGLVGNSEVAQLAGGYGMLMMAAALWLIGGLGLRETLRRRATSTSLGTEPVSTAAAR